MCICSSLVFISFLFTAMGDKDNSTYLYYYLCSPSRLAVINTAHHTILFHFDQESELCVLALVLVPSNIIVYHLLDGQHNTTQPCPPHHPSPPLIYFTTINLILLLPFTTINFILLLPFTTINFIIYSSPKKSLIKNGSWDSKRRSCMNRSSKKHFKDK